ncbi:MAG: ABC transporter substrate-binding protein [Armatimonadetes bacterium]|nr:ABC transporter substrate-binding protein [Armatimonadota bacterium]
MAGGDTEGAGSDRPTRFTRRRLLSRAARLGASAAVLASAGDRLGLPDLIPQADAAAATPKRGGTLRFGLPNEPLTLSGTMTGGDQGLGIVMSSIYDTLCVTDYTTNSPKPGLAVSWTRKDPTTWIVKMRQGVQFHKNYGEVTAEDAVFTINTTIEKKHTGVFAWQSVKGAEVMDRHTFAIHLTRAYQPLPLTALGSVGGNVISKKAFEEMGREKFERNPVGAGPFEFKEWKEGSEIVLTRFEKYWQKGLPYLDRIDFKIVKDHFVRQNLLKTRGLDVIFTLQYKDVEEMRQTPGIAVHSVPGQTFDFIAFNPKDPIVGNRLVRRAVATAINRNAIVSDVYYGQAVPTNIPTPKGFVGYTSKVWYPYGGDVARARQLLKEAGYPNGVSFPIIVSDKLQLRRELEIISGQLARAGIKVEIQGLDLGTFNARFFGPDVTKKNFRAALRDIAIVSPDPDSTVYWFHHKGTTGWVGFESAQIDGLLDDARAEPSSQKRDQLYKQLFDVIIPEATYIYTAHANYISASRSNVRNWVQLPTSIARYTGVWLDR